MMRMMGMMMGLVGMMMGLEPKLIRPLGGFSLAPKTSETFDSDNRNVELGRFWD